MKIIPSLMNSTTKHFLLIPFLIQKHNTDFMPMSLYSD